MNKIYMQFPYREDSRIYDGRLRIIQPFGVVRVRNTNVYVMKYYDCEKENKPRITLVQKSNDKISQIPLMNKKGLVDLYNKNFIKSALISVSSFIGNSQKIGVTRTFEDLDDFMDVLEESRKKENPNVKNLVNRFKEARKSIEGSVHRDEIYILKEYEDSVLDSVRDYEESLANIQGQQVNTTDRGDLGFYSPMTPGEPSSAIGPGRQNSFGRPMAYVGGMGMAPMGRMMAARQSVVPQDNGNPNLPNIIDDEPIPAPPEGGGPGRHL